MQKFLFMMGLFLIVISLIWPFLTDYLKLGKLPGDIIIKRGNFTIYFPVVTSLIVSIVISIILWLLNK